MLTSSVWRPARTRVSTRASAGTSEGVRFRVASTSVVARTMFLVLRQRTQRLTTTSGARAHVVRSRACGMDARRSVPSGKHSSGCSNRVRGLAPTNTAIDDEARCACGCCSFGFVRDGCAWCGSVRQAQQWFLGAGPLCGASEHSILTTRAGACVCCSALTVRDGCALIGSVRQEHQWLLEPGSWSCADEHSD